MAGLVPAIHDLICGKGVDARHEAGHDGGQAFKYFSNHAIESFTAFTCTASGA
jgi:hypothetical protein